MCFSVRASAQSALFRRMRFSSPGQTSSHLTEKRILELARSKKRILAAVPHGKAHSGCGPKRPFDPQEPRRRWSAPRPNVPWVLPRTAFREGDLFAGWTIFFLQDSFSAGQTDVSHVPQHVPLLLRSPRTDRPVRICSPACQSCLCSITAILFALEYGACLAVEQREK